MLHPRQNAFWLCLFLLVLRGYNRLFYAEVWAEDGTIFLSEWLEHGGASLLMPHLGSYHTLQRLVVLSTVTLFPVGWFPLMITGFCYLFAAGVFSIFAKPTYRWLIASDGVRIFFGALLCVAPGLNEMLGNLPNINWMMYLWLGLLALKDPSERLSICELVFAAIVVISTGTFPLLIPLFAWRLWIEPKENRKWTMGVLVIMMLGAAWLLLHPGDRPESSPITSTWDLLLHYLHHMIGLGLIHPWVGDKITSLLSRPHLNLLWWGLGVVVLSWAAFTMWKNRREKAAQGLVLLFSLTSLWTLLAWLTRPRSLAQFEFELSKPFLLMRYAFPVAAVALLLWVYLIQQSSWTPRTKKILFTLLLLIPILSHHRIQIGAYGYDRRWSREAPRFFESVEKGCPPSWRIPIYPENWCIGYISPTPNPDCLFKTQVNRCHLPEPGTPR